MKVRLTPRHISSELNFLEYFSHATDVIPCEITLHMAQRTLSLFQGLILKPPDSNRGGSIAVLRSPSQSPSDGAAEVTEGMVVKGGVEIAVDGVMVGIAVEVVVEEMAMEGEDEGVAAEDMMVEVIEGVTVELSLC